MLLSFRSIVLLALAAIAIAVFHFGGPSHAQQGAIDSMTTASVARNDDVLRTYLDGQPIDCWFVGEAGERQGTPFRGGECARTGLPLASAAQIERSGLGDVSVLDETGQELAVFTTADGEGLELAQPNGRFVSLMAAQTR